MAERVAGLISCYGLTEWWFTVFSEQERAYMNERFNPTGMPANSLTEGSFGIDHPIDLFLNGLATWFRSQEDLSIADRIRGKLVEVSGEAPRICPGNVNGRHFTTYVEEVRQAKREGTEREKTLLALVEATESESRSKGWGVAPWYYEELAKLYRKRKDYASEVSILERFARQQHAPGVKPPRLLDRLERARQLCDAARQTKT